MVADFSAITARVMHNLQRSRTEFAMVLGKRSLRMCCSIGLTGVGPVLEFEDDRGRQSFEIPPLAVLTYATFRNLRLTCAALPPTSPTSALVRSPKGCQSRGWKSLKGATFLTCWSVFRRLQTGANCLRCNAVTRIAKSEPYQTLREPLRHSGCLSWKEAGHTVK